MRKLLAIALASTFLTAAPVAFAPQTVEAAGLFEALFPRAAERRRKRTERRRRIQLERFEYEQKRVRDAQRARKKFLKAQRRAKKRRAIPIEKAKVKGPSFKRYTPKGLPAVRLATMSNAFSAYDQKLLAEDALQRTKPKSDKTETTTGSLNSPDFVVKPTLIAAKVDESSPVTSVEPIVKTIDRVRLSAGGELLNKLKLRTSRAIGKSLVKHYKASPKFIWVSGDGKPNEASAAALRVLAEADQYGLRLEDYSLPIETAGYGATEEEILLAAMKFEFALSGAVLRYMSDARNGVVDPNKISGYHDFKGLGSNFSKILGEVSASDDPSKLMLSVHPKTREFRVLKEQLVTLREKVKSFDGIKLNPKTFLKPGGQSTELENIVESIRRKTDADFASTHFDAFALDLSDGVYEPEIVELVRDFQKSMKLKPDGIIGKNTISKMRVADPNVQLNKVLYAMERMRWHPDTFGNRYVFINQPAYRATYWNNGRPQLSMRTVVGKPSNQTYFFHDKIDYVEFNPYWGIPRSILVNEMLPKLRRNAGYLDRLGYEITNTRGKRISSSSVDWYSVGANFPYNVRQPPSRKNALGELKIMFPNKHSIYMHDTPAKSLFKRSKRAYSHGCVRLAEPRKMAAAVLGTSVGSVSQKIAAGKNKQQRLKGQVNVFVAYFTAWPDSAGNVKFYSDIYGRDRALAKAMSLETNARAIAAKGV